MSIPSLSQSQTSPVMDLFKQRRAAMQSMEQAVQSGDISAAQKGLATLQSVSPSSAGSQPSGGASNPFRSMMKNDLAGLTSAVASGDITSAQSALQKLQSDRASAGGPGGAGGPGAGGAGGSGGGGGVGGPGGAGRANGPPPPPRTDSSSSSSSTGSSFLDSLKALLTSSLSGDTDGAQSAASALQTDIEKVFGSTASSAATSTSAAQSKGGGASSFLSDLEALINSAQSGDTSGAQKAAQSVATEIQNAIGGAGPAGGGGVHGQHHHAGGPPPADTSNNQTSAAQGAAGPDADGDTQGGAISSARAAIELLMNFAKASQSTDATA